MARTIVELDKVMKEFEEGVEKRFLERTPLGAMMTKKDAEEHTKLVAEYVEAIHKKEEETAYIELNNLYLAIQRGEVKLTRREYNKLNDLLGQVYDHKESMHDWWWKEFQKLPGWLNV